jgi:hypothetical protein
MEQREEPGKLFGTAVEFRRPVRDEADAENEADRDQRPTPRYLERLHVQLCVEKPFLVS